MKIKEYGHVRQKDRDRFEVPGFSGYFVNKEGQVYSLWGANGIPDNMRLVKPWVNYYKGKPSGLPRVALRDDTGKKHNLYLHNVVQSVKDKNVLGELF